MIGVVVCYNNKTVLFVIVSLVLPFKFVYLLFFYLLGLPTVVYTEANKCIYKDYNNMS